MEIKICTKCKKEFPVTADYFYKDKRAKSGLRSTCIGCHKQYNREHHEEKAIYNRQYREDNREHLNECSKNWRKNNSEYAKQYIKQWHVNNPDYMERYNKQYYEANREKEITASRQWRKDNSEYIKQWRKDNRERRSESTRRWQRANRDVVNARNARYRATKLNQTAAEEDMEEIRRIYKICSDMNARAKFVSLSEVPLNGAWFHVDHGIPLSKGGLHHEENLQIMWWLDNLRKNAEIL